MGMGLEHLPKVLLISHVQLVDAPSTMVPRKIYSKSKFLGYGFLSVFPSNPNEAGHLSARGGFPFMASPTWLGCLPNIAP